MEVFKQVSYTDAFKTKYQWRFLMEVFKTIMEDFNIISYWFETKSFCWRVVVLLNLARQTIWDQHINLFTKSTAFEKFDCNSQT